MGNNRQIPWIFLIYCDIIVPQDLCGLFVFRRYLCWILAAAGTNWQIWRLNINMLPHCSGVQNSESNFHSHRSEMYISLGKLHSFPFSVCRDLLCHLALGPFLPCHCDLWAHGCVSFSLVASSVMFPSLVPNLPPFPEKKDWLGWAHLQNLKFPPFNALT